MHILGDADAVFAFMQKSSLVSIQNIPHTFLLAKVIADRRYSSWERQEAKYQTQFPDRLKHRVPTRHTICLHSACVIRGKENIDVIRQWLVSLSEDRHRISTSFSQPRSFDVEQNGPPHSAAASPSWT